LNECIDPQRQALVFTLFAQFVQFGTQLCGRSARRLSAWGWFIEISNPGGSRLRRGLIGASASRQQSAESKHSAPHQQTNGSIHLTLRIKPQTRFPRANLTYPDRGGRSTAIVRYDTLSAISKKPAELVRRRGLYVVGRYPPKGHHTMGQIVTCSDNPPFQRPIHFAGIPQYA
jgi:hypothetical protein